MAPWFDPNAYAWLPGTLFGTLGGLWGTCAGVLAPRGKARGFVLGSGVAFVAIALALLIAGIIALATGQPYGVWFGLLLPGAQGAFMLPFLFPLVRTRYRQAEERRIQAADFR